VARSDRNGPPFVIPDQPDTSAPASRAAVRPAVLAIAALFAFVVLIQGIGAPFQKDAEPQSAEWIQSIVRDGHWLIPADAYGYTDRKPPLFYWLSAIVAKATGGTVDEVRARVVSVVAGTTLAVGVLAWTLANLGAFEGWLAFLFMLGIYGFASRATEALTDMLLTVLLFAAYSAIYPLLDSAPVASSRRIIFVGVVLGLGILTKGPIAIVLCALAASIFLLVERRNPIVLLRQRWPWQVVAIAIAIGAIWYVPAALVGGHKIVRIIFAENFGHFMPARLGGTGESYRPFYFIAARLLGGAFPMTLLIVPAALAFYTGEISTEKRRPVIYQISMSLAVLLFFSIASVKRDDYILPALPGIAIFCASVFTLSARGAASRLRDVVVAIYLLGPIFVFAFLLVFRGHTAHMSLQSSDAAYLSTLQLYAKRMVQTLVLTTVMWLLALVTAVVAIFRGRGIVTGTAFGVFAVAGSLFFTAGLRPALAVQRSMKIFVPVIVENVKGAQLCIPSGINYELSYYYGAAVPYLGNPKCAYLLATPRELDSTKPEYRARLKLIAKSNLIGGGGPPALFAISPEAAK
jgi:4-amino-4-deoxy-L-arabinose transferase-like glycosyltransferase